MPGTLAVDDILKFAWCVRTSTNQNQINVQRYKVRTIQGNAPDLAELVKSVSAAVGNILKPGISTRDTYEGCKVTRITLPVEATLFSDQGRGPGSLNEDAMVSQSSVLASLKAAGSPPKVRGRMYFPRGTEVDEDEDGTLRAVALALYAGRMQNLLTLAALNAGAQTTATLDHVIHHTVGQATFHYVTTNFIIREEFATQRRRSSINRGDGPFA